MMQRLLRVTCLALVFALAASPAFAQGGATSSLSGVVQDSSSGAIPGATVVVKSNSTGTTFEATTASNGTFSIPALAVGSYTVTITIPGFKTFVNNDVRVSAGNPASLRATLEVGGLAETITVQGGAEIIQTQSSTVASTMTANQISNLPLSSRNAIDFVTFLPGVQTPGGNRDSTVNGLPQSTINITVDGMNVQDNFLKTTDGFFARMSPRLDAVEEVTVTTAANGADSSGQGAVQIRFVTRSGSNDFHGAAYHYYRTDSLNANNWFNNRDGLPKAALLQNQPGMRLSGPVRIPGLFDGRDRAFFMVNYEELRQPQDITRTRVVLHPNALNGTFRYNATVGGQTVVREVNLLSLAAANGHLSTPDPTVNALYQAIRSATLSTGVFNDRTDPLTQDFVWVGPAQSKNIYPTARVDLNVTNRHRVTGSYNFQNINANPDTTNNREARFPGFGIVGIQDSDRYTTSASVRSTFSANIVNEFRLGATGGATKFNPQLTADMYGEFLLNINNGIGLANAGAGPTTQTREASTRLLENTLNWAKGSHSLSLGGSFTNVSLWLQNQTLVPTITFGIVSGDPADSMFNTTNFPDASQANLNAARAFYAQLVGRVSTIGGDVRLNEDTGLYEYLALGTQRGGMNEAGLFVQDSWRVRPNLTVNLGLRYELQFPFYPKNSSYLTGTIEDLCGVSGVNAEGRCNLFTLSTPGRKPVFNRFEEGTKAYDTDYNNFAPSAGFAWSPGEGSGWRRIIGAHGDTVVRAGFARSYNRPGMSDFSGVYGGNPGIQLNGDRSLALGNLGALPLLLSDRSRLGPGTFPTTLSLPFTEVATGDISMFADNLQVPSADSWQIGVQRAISRNMALEVRYVGTRSKDGWQTRNHNELNIFDNGFLQEFRNAQANLQANIAAGRGNTFRYNGPGTGTVPLPIFLAYFSGVPASQAGDSTRYTSTLFGNNTFLGPLAVFNPNPFNAADNLDADAARRANAIAAGLPANFLVANPDLLGGANLVVNESSTRYHSLQVELRRRLANGLQFDANYVFGKAYESVFETFRREPLQLRNGGAEGDVTHALKSNIVYELPFGRGQRFGRSAGPILDRIIGGWQVAGTLRVQSGRLVDLGNVTLVGMEPGDVSDLFKLRIDDDGRVWMLPQDVIDETVKAFSVSATSATGYGAQGPPSGRYFAPANSANCIEPDNGDDYGECGTRSLVVTGPMFRNVDLSVVKRVQIFKRLTGEFRVEMLNAFNLVNFVPVGGIGNDPDDFEVTDLNGQNIARTIQLVTRFTW